jgi:thiol-disulfide isomerase/thioredoxin
MTRNATIGAGVIAIIVVAAIVYVLSSDDSAMMQKDEAMMEGGSAAGGTMLEGSAMPENGMVGGDAMVEGDTTMKDEGTMMKKGSYEAYAPEKLALAQQGDVLLFFHAPWCPICKAIETEITGNSGTIPEGVTILKVDFDSATELRKKYGVTVQHTFVQVRADGSVIAKWSDSTSLAGVLRKVQ